MRMKFVLAAALAFAHESALTCASGQPGSVLWMYQAPDLITTSPALAQDGTVYIGAGTTFCAITNSGAAGSNRWTFNSAVAGSPAVGPDGTIYFSGGGGLYALGPDGSQKWHFPAGNGSPAIALDGTIYVVGAGTLYAVKSGTNKWQYLIDDPSTGNDLSPVVGNDGTVYIGSHSSSAFYAINPDGTLRWRASDVGWIGESAAIAADRTVYFTGGPLRALSPAAGTVLWSNSTNDFSLASPVIGLDGTILVASYPSKTLYQFTAAGQATWHALSENYAFGPPAPTVPVVGSGGVIYYCVSNSVVALSSQGVVQWTVTRPGAPPPGIYWATTSPVIGSNGTIYAALANTLYAIASGASGALNSPWPMYRQNPRHTGKVEKPVLTQPQKRADANFEFQLYPQQLGLNYTVESSSNFCGWTSVTSFVANTLPVDVVDLTASNAPVRFYRAFSSP